MFAHMDSLRVVLEGLSSFHRRAQAIRDADAGWPPRDSPSQYASVLTRRVGPAPRPSKCRK